MAQVNLSIGDRTYVVACADGGETRLAELGATLNRRWPDAARAAGNGGAERTMLLVALMLADDLDDAANRGPAVPLVNSEALDALAARLESLAEALEDRAPSA